LIASPGWSSIPAVPEIQELAPDRLTKTIPTDTEKMVTGTDGVVVMVVVVDVAVDGVVDVGVDTGGVVVVVSTGIVDVVVVEVFVGVVEFVQANTLVRTNKDRTKIIRILPDTDLFIFISCIS
jgi:tRNA1(Val) A37 N6-methylase TrmN6